MAVANASMTSHYQQPIWGRMDPLLRKCFTVSGILGLLVLILVFVAPTPAPESVSIAEVPDRLARLILEKPKPVAPSIKLPERVALEQPKVETPPVTQPPPPRRRTSPPKVAESRGVKGREIAQKEVTQNLAQVTGSLDKVLDNLSKSLPASETPSGEAKPRSRRRSVRTGRSSQQLAAIGGSSSLSAPDVSRSAIESKGISIDAISDLAVQGPSGGDLPGGSGSSGGVSGGRNDYRSNEALLSVVRRYAPGIQFCYDNELKKNPGLRGKLVISLTVLANGTVSEALVVDDGLRSKAITSCVLAQIRGWQFPAIPEGTITFKTPFVFTPPE